MNPLERLHAIDASTRTKAARAGFWIVAGLLLLNLLFGDMGVLAGIRQRRVASQLRSEVASLQIDHDALAADIQALNSNPYRIESIAREELGLARPGEIIFLFPSGGGATTPSSGAAPSIGVAPSSAVAPSAGPSTSAPARPAAAPTHVRPTAAHRH